MPLPPNFTCPVCQKKKQRGLLGIHLIKHSTVELLPYITNLSSMATPGWHPQLQCREHTYILCPHSEKGYEKDKPLHKSHTCLNDYSKWSVGGTIKKAKSTHALQAKTMQEVIDVCKAKGIGGYSGLRKGAIINLIEKHEPKGGQCKCHFEITKLKEELESFKKWKHTILTCMPGSKLEPEAVFVVNLPELNKITEKPVIQDTGQVLVEDSSQALVEDSSQAQDECNDQTIQKKSTIKKRSVPLASKKEIEKGMWCTRCESCRYVAQYTKDLKPCGSCQKLCHFNDDMGNCYLWDCVTCNKAICKECNKASGGNRLQPYCSKVCAAANNE